MPPRRLSRDESWQSLHHSEASAENNEDISTDVSMEDGGDPEQDTLHVESPRYPTVNDVRKSIHPLQAIADRVGQQVEEFAKSLDRINTKTRQASKGDCRDVLPFVKEYHRIAHATVEKLKIVHASERKHGTVKRRKSKSGRSSTRSPGGGKMTVSKVEEERLTTVEDLQRWEEEEQTWDLLASMLEVDFPVPESERSALETYTKGTHVLIRPAHDVKVNKYSPEKTVWDNFLATDDLAWERYTVAEWLKSCADKSRPDIDHIVEELESQADRGSGLWAHSWLYTKEAIKAQKRLRSWPQALDPNSPGLDVSLVGSARKTALVSQLDPDAISRQGRELEKQDTAFERAIWVACWEMLRRGKDWDYVHNWCLERGELWRSTAMRSDFRFQTNSSANWQSRHLWRKACAVAAKNGGNDDYEKAVYGALSGYLPSVLSIARGWDDYLFAHYNSYLLHSFDRHIKTHYPDRISHLTPEAFQFSVFAGQRSLSGNQIVEKMKQEPETKEEATRAIKALQGSLIARAFETFVFKQGVRITRLANHERASKTIKPLSLSLLEGTQTLAIGTEDFDLLRILTHIIFIFSSMGCTHESAERRYAVDSIVVAYIDFLSKAGKQQLIPLYASRLSPERIVTCLSRQLPYVLNSEERKIMMKLMTQYGIDVPAVLAGQLHAIIEDGATKLRPEKNYPKPEILEKTKNDVTSPYRIKPDFIGTDISNEEFDLIHALEWFMLLEGHWAESFLYGAEVYKYFMSKYSQQPPLLEVRGNLTFRFYLQEPVPWPPPVNSPVPSRLLNSPSTRHDRYWDSAPISARTSTSTMERRRHGHRPRSRDAGR